MRQIETIHFSRIVPEMREAVERIRLRSGKIHSAASFQSIYYWQDVQKLDIYLKDSMYLVRCRDRGTHDYFMPVGNADEIRALLTGLTAESAFRLHYADLADVRRLMQWFPAQCRPTFDRDSSEYIYDLNVLTAMQGGAYARIRKLVHRISQQDGLQIRQITAENRQDMQQILTEWSSMQTDTESSDLEAAQRMIASVGEFPFFGILIDLAGKPAAAAGGFPLSEDTFDVCFVKDSREINGLGVFARCMLAQQLAGKYRFIDAEEDLGRPGLRAMKSSLNPVKMIRMWEVAFLDSSNC